MHMGPVMGCCHIVIVIGVCSGGGGWLNNSCQRWRGAIEQWLPEVVVVGDGGDAVGVVVMMVVIEKGKACLLY